MDMQVVEFQGKVENGAIKIPEGYQKELDGEFIKVIVMKPNRQLIAVDFLDELMANPVAFDGKPLSRDEIYDRGF